MEDPGRFNRWLSSTASARSAPRCSSPCWRLLTRLTAFALSLGDARRRRSGGAAQLLLARTVDLERSPGGVPPARVSAPGPLPAHERPHFGRRQPRADARVRRHPWDGHARREHRPIPILSLANFVASERLVFRQGRGGDRFPPPSRCMLQCRRAGVTPPARTAARGFKRQHWRPGLPTSVPLTRATTAHTNGHGAILRPRRLRRGGMAEPRRAAARFRWHESTGRRRVDRASTCRRQDSSLGGSHLRSRRLGRRGAEAARGARRQRAEALRRRARPPGCCAATATGYHVFMKLRRTKVITATYNTEHDVSYRRLGRARAIEPQRRHTDRRAR